ncbi:MULTISPECIES: ribokinase [Rhizobium/Agrobacterium group]|jgi:ribokinase|uniref:ribokinase n=1 Tax=Rhizobium/Agrobacterium group TaxID=227290 RepID=UPI00023A35D1|nr:MULTISPECIES: ribokinase [Rhizobium/Agrobacterium group]AHK05108.1 ribokinase [Agrobacterium tumefaciens LBA4213 (Ach5)]AKC10834.1 ribokinase [Agrobacterium tumefaciens]EHJ96417.1 ribokinase [Agrobacterium tumefaciens 5A]AYM20217.1 ribokinase [Agrobacterium tumefaciens]AYM71520.1 ribokinase [Agrobacterium tumefaciens]
MSKKIGVVGSNMVDLITYVNRMPGPGETLEAPAFEMGCGGKGANQAVAAARLGADVMMVTRVGDDVFGDNTIRNLESFGVDTRHVVKVAGKSSGVAPIFVEQSGENSILIVKGANADLLPAEVDKAAADLKQCGLILMQMEVPVETVYHTIELAAQNGIETILNPAPAAANLDPERIRQVTFLVPNESELALLSGLPTETDEAIITAARSLIARGIRTVIVTLGGRGARVITSDEIVNIEPVKVTPKDTTGAGDAFIGSFARFYAETGEVVSSLKKASLYAAHSITRPGTQKAYASIEEFEAFCREHDHAAA